jgi:type II secretory ATPase GspE/PulE/Tfp pilus assembly ATPase PilB-like protein
MSKTSIFTKYDPAQKETPESKFPSILPSPKSSACPTCIAARRSACHRLDSRTRTSSRIISLRAKDAADALLRLLALKPGEKLASAQGGRAQRLVRKLCERCREAFQPDPALLQRLGIPPGRVQVLYQEKQPPQPGQERKRGVPEICPACRGLGYRGRTAIFELLVLDDRLRQALRKQPNLDAIKQLARSAGNRTLQEEGVLLVALGITSLAELQRVLKQ